MLTRDQLPLETGALAVVEHLLGRIVAHLDGGHAFMALGRRDDPGSLRVVAATPGGPLAIGSALPTEDQPWQHQRDLDAVLVPLTDWLGQPCGVLGVVASTDALVGDDFQVRLPDYVELASLALVQDSVHRYVDGLVRTSAAMGSRDFARLLARSVADIFHAQMGFVAELSDDRLQASTLAFWNGDGFVDNVTYDLTDTPCNDVYRDGFCVVRRDAQQIFPKDQLLQDLGVHGYAGVAFTDASGRALAHLGVMHTQPISASFPELSAFHLLAIQAGAEYARRRAVDQRLEIERQLVLSQSRESLGMLAGNIAHDLNNLLVGITGNLGLAERQLPPSSPALRHIQDADATAQRAADLLRQLLSYSGGGRLDVTPTDLNELITETTELLEISLPKHISLRHQLAPSLPSVRVDGTEMRQVLMNLVMNAAQAIDGVPGVITIRTHTDAAPTPSGEAPTPQIVVIEVQDTGCGMSPQTRSRIFEPYFTTKDDGSGLGLAAVYGVVRGHGGQIQVDSATGQGSTFRIRLPLSPQGVHAVQSPTPTQATPDAPSRTRVLGIPTVRPTSSPVQFPVVSPGSRALIVDDDHVVRRVAANILQSAGFQVDQAASGEQGLHMVRHGERPPDIIVLDMTMPGMNGAETFEALHALHPEIPVLLVSGYGQHDTVDTFPGARPAAFLQKPFGVDSLLNKVTDILTKKGRVEAPSEPPEQA